MDRQVTRKTGDSRRHTGTNKPDLTITVSGNSSVVQTDYPSTSEGTSGSWYRKNKEDHQHRPYNRRGRNSHRHKGQHQEEYQQQRHQQPRHLIPDHSHQQPSSHQNYTKPQQQQNPQHSSSKYQHQKRHQCQHQQEQQLYQPEYPQPQHQLYQQEYPQPQQEQHQLYLARSQSNETMGTGQSHNRKDNLKITPLIKIKEYFTNAGLSIICYTGDVTSAGAEGIVTAEDLNKKNPSMVTQSLLGTAGIKYKDLWKAVEDTFKPTRLHYGDVFPLHTREYGIKLQFKVIFVSVVLPHEEAANDYNWKFSMVHLYLSILNKADKNGLTSLAIPLLGSGKAKAPLKLAIEALVSALSVYQAKNHLHDIMLVSSTEVVLKQMIYQWDDYFNTESRPSALKKGSKTQSAESAKESKPPSTGMNTTEQQSFRGCDDTSSASALSKVHHHHFSDHEDQRTSVELGNFTGMRIDQFKGRCEDQEVDVPQNIADGYENPNFISSEMNMPQPNTDDEDLFASETDAPQFHADGLNAQQRNQEYEGKNSTDPSRYDKSESDPGIESPQESQQGNQMYQQEEQGPERDYDDPDSDTEEQIKMKNGNQMPQKGNMGMHEQKQEMKKVLQNAEVEALEKMMKSMEMPQKGSEMHEHEQELKTVFKKDPYSDMEEMMKQFHSMVMTQKGNETCPSDKIPQTLKLNQISKEDNDNCSYGNVPETSKESSVSYNPPDKDGGQSSCLDDTETAEPSTEHGMFDQNDSHSTKHPDDLSHDSLERCHTTMGNQPPGEMKDWVISHVSCPGYEGHGVIVIDYYFEDGMQTEHHPHPGEPYRGTKRRGFLPDTDEGRSILELLHTAFDRKLTFKIDRSTYISGEYRVTWNDIPHKTNTHGGPDRNAYPDETYFPQVIGELAKKGITKEQGFDKKGNHQGARI